MEGVPVLKVPSPLEMQEALSVHGLRLSAAEENLATDFGRMALSPKGQRDQRAGLGAGSAGLLFLLFLSKTTHFLGAHC